jgi:hypothetical protein
MNETSTISTGKTIFAVVTLVFVFLVLLGIGANANHGSNVAMPGYVMGYNTALAAIAAGIFHLVFRKRTWRFLGLAAFAAFFLALTLGGNVASHKREKAEIRQAASEVKDALGQMEKNIEAGTVPGAMPVQAATTDAGKMGAVLKTMVNRSNALRNDYQQELTASGFNGILDPDRLARDKRMKESQELMAKAQAVVAKYKEKNETLFAMARKDIEQSGISDDKREDMLRGFDEKLASGRKLMAEGWASETEMLAVFDKIVKLLHAAQGKWEVQQKQLMFERDSDIAAFNGYMAEIAALTAKQEAMQRQRLQKAQNTMDSLGK